MATDPTLTPPTPTVSVIIPLYNLRPYVAEAIESVLAETIGPDALEIVVVDDGSVDGGGEVVQRFGTAVRYLRQENRGPSAARNAGLRATRAPFVSFLDADDRMMPEKLARELAVFAARPEVDVVYSGFHYVDEHLARLPQQGWSTLEGDLFPALVLSNRLHVFQALVRRVAIERIGGFDESIAAAEDWDVWIRLARTGVRWASLDEPLAVYRIRGDGSHRAAGQMAENAVRVLDKLFADPTLPAEVVATKPLAYHNAYLTAAANHYSLGDRAEGARWFAAAARLRPEFVVDPTALSAFCRRLLPVGWQRSATMALEWRRLATTLRHAIDDLFATPDLVPALRGRRRRAQLAALRALAPLIVRRVKMRARGTPGIGPRADAARP
jgi:glycosyltransferase involved in cell wall biosynthesis